MPSQILIISHFAFKDEDKGAVFPQNIRNFLLKRIGKLTYIDHPFPEANFPASQITIYENSERVYQLTSPMLKLPTLFLFIYQFFLTIFFLIIKPVKYDLVIACDNLSFISTLIFRKLGLIKKLIYYTVDYSPKRFNNRFLNSLYQYMDRVACMISDKNWVTVKEMVTAKTQNGLDLKKCAPFQIVPIGFNKNDIALKPTTKVNRFNLVFAGVLYEKQGLQLVINSLPKLIKKFPRIKLTIIGDGPYKSDLKKIIEQKKLKSYVKFCGYINNHREVVKIILKNGIGLATYNPRLGDYSYYADPSKIKLYLLCGLPVITTEVPPIAKKIDKEKSGIVIDYSETDLINALEILFVSKKYAKYRNNALKTAKSYDDNIILEKAFREL